ncbi:FadR family transcriptional regulator [Clostridium fermenticellae]|uniref:FadR family transcriptional regulator n=1 Tax=Clostridium fermenticellae TaxID=2068654 RepID=A0A386H4B1_9CLOT|nr:FadR/GntR family transcriptional regulator [Clostridium fermenticellae]AYD40373.1 FadR family transcriptional regulator [Clostridium fermenticellae]
MFSPIRSTKVYEQVIEQVKNMIIDGTLKKGDKLPSERELVEHLEVSRTSIREALRALQIIGLVECRQGEGNFIKQSFENNLFEPLSIMFMLQKSDPNEIMELRKIIEIETAAIAAKRVTSGELDSMIPLINILKNSKSEEERVKADKDFHYTIARASKNFLIVSILNAVSSLIDSFIKDARRKILVDKENVDVLAKQHKDIYLSLKDGDSKKASEAMRKHLDFANEYMMKD